jgi:Single-strand binding protein family
MSAFVLIRGTIFRVPEQKTSKNGKPYTVATIKSRDGETSEYWRVCTFFEPTQSELLRLSDGDAVSAQGTLRAEAYARPGEGPRVNLTVLAEHTLAPRQPPKKRAQKVDANPRRPQRQSVAEIIEDDLSF